MNQGKFYGVQAGAWLLVAGIAMASSEAIAQAHPATVPDAQVESNVLKALASDQRLAKTTIKSTTVYGTVTLSGNVEDEATRTEAETVVSRTAGVLKVVDELTLGAATAAREPLPAASPEEGTNPNLQSDGTIAPQTSPSSPSTPASPGNQSAQAAGDSALWGPAGPPPDVAAQGSTAGPNPNGAQAQQAPYAQPYPSQKGAPSGYPPNAAQNYPPQGYPQNYPGQAPGAQGGYGPPSQYPNGANPNYGGGRPGYGAPPQYPYGAPNYGGQQGGYAQPPNGGNPNRAGQPGGQVVNVPGGAVLRVRLNRGIDSRSAQPGNLFDGVVVNDIIASGNIAIPRGAAVQGVVVDAEKAGVLKGRGELQLRLTQVTLGGTVYPLTSDIWGRQGSDKTVRTVDSAIGLGALGAVLGAVTGGGAGAAIGAGVGGAVGVGSSAASGGGQVGVPPEGVIDFHLAQPVQVATLSQAELDRLGYGLPNGGSRGIARRYPGAYYAPGYYAPGPYYGPRYYPYARYPY